MDNASNNETLLARWLAAELSEEELAAFQQREDFADLQQIVAGMEGLAPPAFSDTEAWAKLKAKRERADAPLQGPGVETPVRKLNPWRNILSIAAAVAALLVAGWWLFSGGGENYTDQFATGIGEQLEVTLPDGSTATLNAVSELAYSEAEWPAERNAKLVGEAYFRAKKGKTFTILTDQGEVQVVGTRFNVFARGNELEVKCTEGQVQVTSPNDERALVKAGEQVKVLNGRMQRRRGLDGSPKWLSGQSAFKHKTAAHIFDELERQYGVVVLEDGLGDGTYTTSFPHDNLDVAIRNLCQTMQLECTVSGDTLRVQ